MRFFLIFLALLLMASGAEAKYSPALEMAGNITMGDYSITGMVNGTAAQDAATYSQALQFATIPLIAGPPTVYVYKQGGKIFAINSSGGEIASGTQTTDDDTVIAAAYAALPAGRMMQFGPGDFYDVPTFEMTSTHRGCSIVGSGILNTALHFSGTGHGFNITDDFITISDMWLRKSTANGTTNTSAIYCNVSFSSNFINLMIGPSTDGKDWRNGIIFNQTSDPVAQTGNCVVSGCYIAECLYAGIVDNARSNFISDTTLSENLYNVVLRNGGNYYTRCTLSGTTTAINVWTDQYTTHVPIGASFVQCWLENSIYEAVWVYCGYGLSFRSCTLHSMGSYNNAIVTLGYSTAPMNNTVFENNYFTDTGHADFTYDLLVSGASDYVWTAGSYDDAGGAIDIGAGGKTVYKT